MDEDIWVFLLILQQGTLIRHMFDVIKISIKRLNKPGHMYEWQPGALLLLWTAYKFFSHLFSEVSNAGTLMMKKKSYKLRYLHTNEDKTKQNIQHL